MDCIKATLLRNDGSLQSPSLLRGVRSILMQSIRPLAIIVAFSENMKEEADLSLPD